VVTGIFNVLLVLSIFVMLLVVARLYQAIQLLEARVSILSSSLKNLREATMTIVDADSFEDLEIFDHHETELRKSMRRDFTHKKYDVDRLLAESRKKAQPPGGSSLGTLPGGSQPPPDDADGGTRGRRKASDIRGMTLNPSLARGLMRARGSTQPPAGDASTPLPPKKS